jgi:hypothetical protein
MNFCKNVRIIYENIFNSNNNNNKIILKLYNFNRNIIPSILFYFLFGNRAHYSYNLF